MDNPQNFSAPRDAPSPQAAEAAQVKHTSVAAVFLLTFITGGIYFPVWFLTRRAQFNKLQSREKLGKGLLIFGIVAFSGAAALSLFSGLAVFILSMETVADLEALYYYGNLAANVIILIAILPLVRETFKVRRILVDHYKGYLHRDVTFSFILTLLLLNLYLQYKINTLGK